MLFLFDVCRILPLEFSIKYNVTVCATLLISVICGTLEPLGSESSLFNFQPSF